MAADGLPSNTTLYEEAIAGLRLAANASFAITPDMEVQEILDPDFVLFNETNRSPPRMVKERPVAVSKSAKAPAHIIVARGFWGSLFGGLKDFLTSEFFGALCDLCEAFGAFR